ncbi:hypothetical protein B0H14DRAFT_2707967, partial [Mycena olivaceomarginata]
MFNDPVVPLVPFASSSSSNTTSLVCFTSIYSSFANFLGGIQTELELWRTRQYHEYRHDAEPELVKAGVSYRSQTMRRDTIDPLAAKKIAGFRPTPLDSGSGSSPPYFVVGRNKAHHPRISFFPHDGLGAGVAMGLAFYQEGMVMKQSSIEFCLPPSLRRAEVLPFRFKVGVSSRLSRLTHADARIVRLVAWIQPHLRHARHRPRRSRDAAPRHVRADRTAGCAGVLCLYP